MSAIIEVTPTISTSAYASGDQLGDVQTLDCVNFNGGGLMAKLAGLTLVDKAQQKKAIDLFFFSTAPTVGSNDNDAISITDAEVATRCCGHLSIAATDYKDTNGASVACLRNVGMALKPVKDGQLFVVCVVRDTPTYGSTSDLVFKYLFDWK